MIDIFSILLTHGLILVAAWRLLFRDDLDTDSPQEEKAARPWLKNRDPEQPAGGDADA